MLVQVCMISYFVDICISLNILLGSVFEEGKFYLMYNG